MSTTFGLTVPSISVFAEKEDTDVVEIAFRSNGIRWTNPLAQLLPDETIVQALDNSNQGIYTIRDIKEAIKKQT